MSVSAKLCTALLAGAVFGSCGAARAQDVTALVKHAGHKTKRAAAAKEPSQAPSTPAPWAAVDPARAGAATPADPRDAAMPGVAHPFHGDESRTSLGAKWNSSNDRTPGQFSAQSVVNQVNRNLGTQGDDGTDAEVGLKFHF